MPPIKTYHFEQNNQSDIVQLTIRAYNFEEAMITLIQTVKHPSDYKCINV
jgi:hypothetical protein